MVTLVITPHRRALSEPAQGPREATPRRLPGRRRQLGRQGRRDPLRFRRAQAEHGTAAGGGGCGGRRRCREGREGAHRAVRCAPPPPALHRPFCPLFCAAFCSTLSAPAVAPPVLPTLPTTLLEDCLRVVLAGVVHKANNPVGEFFEGFIAATCCSPRAQRPPGAAKQSDSPTKRFPAGMPAGGSPDK